MSRFLSRREMLKRAAAAGAVTAVPQGALAQGLSGAGTAEPFENLTTGQSQILESIVARLIPSDENGPGALEAGAARYIDRALGGALADLQDAYANGLAALDAHARDTAGPPFAELDSNQQDAVLGDLESNAARGFTPDAASFFDMVLQHTIEGTFADPNYGGNRDFIGWEMLGYPGLRLAVAADQQTMDARPEMTRLSAYDLPMFDSTDGEGDSP